MSRKRLMGWLGRLCSPKGTSTIRNLWPLLTWMASPGVLQARPRPRTILDGAETPHALSCPMGGPPSQGTAQRRAAFLMNQLTMASPEGCRPPDPRGYLTKVRHMRPSIRQYGRVSPTRGSGPVAASGGKTPVFRFTPGAASSRFLRLSGSRLVGRNGKLHERGGGADGQASVPSAKPAMGG